MTATGTACIFILPYHVHRAEACASPVAARVGPYKLLVYPPFRNGAGLPSHRDLVLADLPFPTGTVRPTDALPELQIGGTPGWAEPFVAADAIRIDVHGLLTGTDLTPASGIAEQLLRVLRLVTRQWWISRGPSESMAPLQHHFGIDADGQPAAGQLYGTRYIIPWLGTERLLSQELLTTCCAFLEAVGDIPSSASLLLDAVYSANHQAKPAAIISAATACEALFSEQAYAAVARGLTTKGKARQAVKIRDLRERVHGGALEIFGRSFRDDEPDAFAAIDALWLARHAVAHGSHEQQGRLPVFSQQESFASAISGSYAFFTWMANLMPRAWPDPMQAFATPLIRGNA